MMYFCCDKPRRNAVEAHANLNGIHYLEVLDDPGQTVEDRQRTLFVHFLTPLNSGQLTADNIIIEGGERVTGIEVINAAIGGDGVLTVEVDKAGDFSVYTFCLVTAALNPDPPSGIDSMFSSIDFSFKVECPSPFDCKPRRICATEPRVEPDIDYLAKDYTSFRRVMLDRMAATLPKWRERHAADQGNMLVELLAHVGDHLSYQQDAVATEAYLGTARRRISVRRHARLVDYFMHDGCNARTWVQVIATGSNVSVNREITVDGNPTTTKLLTRIPEVAAGPVQPGSREHRNAIDAKPVVFELMEDAQLFGAHNEMTFYTWGDQECCLPKSATTAYLKDDAQDRLHLRVGDVLVFEEVLGPRTGAMGDADPARRHAVRLSRVAPEATLENDGVTRTPGALITDPLTGQDYVKIQWDRKDALPFPLCISTLTDSKQYQGDVSVVRGNIVLADHGKTVEGEILGIVPEPDVFLPASAATACDHESPTPLFPRFRPSLDNRPLTHAPRYDAGVNDTARYDRTMPASDALTCSMRDVGPEITLESVLNLDTKVWTPRRDLINSDETDLHFVVEIERDGVAHLRFGGDRYGLRPEPETEFTAKYRVGNGAAGNIAADSLAHIITNQTGIDGVRNVLPAQGGTEPESMEDVRQKAPVAFRRQERAVTPEDYAEVTERQADVQKAAASFRWTGSWHTVFITADRVEGLDVDPAFEFRTRTHVERFRMAGYDLEVDAPRFVPLNIEMFVCVKPDYFRSEVLQALLDVFSNRTLIDGRRGLFHPDNWTFGQTVFLSPLYAAAHAIPGVDSVYIKTFEKMYAPDPIPRETGKLELARLEVARLDNDRNYPERGVLGLELGGGK